ncbi:hypothetical protein [Legionella jordanis]|uniref:Uncharacterized protein n=1 Tax=Legionella jordanis TaxID=456 RepID=A0A0W0VBT1_9GAMM|nr:hypothetical protein [Legionella jordanis]KTD17551.1 hypothetical protein Ljor_1857 [Legionella jordanis]RMX05113.1 hypothetical protein EAW55_00140 [Legionella jordanis]RMX17369.1 hypothetical protein EAS68_10770 [Legionella jordanis]VEH13520.1 Uncharacterised protein [Legionella jordanis]HAT8714436.1 hypothetical protein [Legionella jordanis]
MFFFKKKGNDLTKQKIYDLFSDQENYVSYRDHRKSSNPSYDSPYLWTSDITACVAIGFLHQDGKNSKLELYHSVSEHIVLNIEEELQRNNAFLVVLLKYLKSLANSSKLRIYVAGNPMHSFPDTDLELVYAVVNEAIRYLNKSPDCSLQPISPKQVHYVEAEAATFFITADGRTGTVVDALAAAVPDIMNLFESEQKISHSSLYKEYLKIKNNEIPYSSEIEFVRNKLIYEQLKTLASTCLLKKLAKNKNEEQLALTIVSWNLFLNKPSNETLQLWQEEHPRANIPMSFYRS